MRLKISEQFSVTPGARYRSDGPFSGQEFFEDSLKPMFLEAQAANEILKVDLDGTEGYATSFLDEAFGRLATEFGSEKAWKGITLVSNDEPDWIEEIKSYIFEKR